MTSMTKEPPGGYGENRQPIQHRRDRRSVVHGCNWGDPTLLDGSVPRLAAQPAHERAHLGILVAARVDLQEGHQPLHGEERKRRARPGDSIAPARLPDVHTEPPTVEAPDLPNAQGHVDAVAVE